MKNSPEGTQIVIGVKRGRSILLSSESDCKLRTLLTNLRMAGSESNIHVVRCGLMGLVRSDPAKFGLYLEFEVTKSWVRSLYMRMNYSRRVATISRPIITLAGRQ